MVLQDHALETAQDSSAANALEHAIRASAAERRVSAPPGHVVIVRGGERGVAPLVIDVIDSR